MARWPFSFRKHQVATVGVSYPTTDHVPLAEGGEQRLAWWCAVVSRGAREGAAAFAFALSSDPYRKLVTIDRFEPA